MVIYSSSDAALVDMSYFYIVKMINSLTMTFYYRLRLKMFLSIKKVTIA